MNYLKVSLIIALCSVNLAFAQRAQYFKDSWMELRTQFMAAEKQCTDFNLNGNVKSVVEVQTSNNDSSWMVFNTGGYLLKQRIEERGYPRSITYKYEGNRLIEKRTEASPFKSVTVVNYGSDGFPVSETREYKDNDQDFHYDAKYIYEGKTNITIDYNHSVDLKRYDVTVQEKYDYSYDEKGRVTKVREKTKRSENSYGTTYSFGYDSLNRITQASCIDDCAGSNSCLMLMYTAAYDERGRIIKEGMVDGTIRNATWSYSYGWQGKYNEKGLLAEELYSKTDDFSYRLNPVPQDYESEKTEYFYEYDLKSNWIKKCELKRDERKLIAIRTLEYYH